jgi:hypothetical protein
VRLLKGGKNETRHLYDILAILHHCSTAAPSKEEISYGDEPLSTTDQAPTLG